MVKLTCYTKLRISGQVASHISVRPFLQGITEIPSDLLPSERAMPVGSRREGIFAEASDRLRRSLTAACLGYGYIYISSLYYGTVLVTAYLQ